MGMLYNTASTDQLEINRQTSIICNYEAAKKVAPELKGVSTPTLTTLHLTTLEPSPAFTICRRRQLTSHLIRHPIPKRANKKEKKSKKERKETQLQKLHLPSHLLTPTVVRSYGKSHPHTHPPDTHAYTTQIITKYTRRYYRGRWVGAKTGKQRHCFLLEYM